jgi:hypothetical protein
MSEALEQLLRMGRERFATDLGPIGQDFDAASWEVSSLAQHHTNKRRLYLRFVRYDTLDERLPPLYADVIKCWLLLTRTSSAQNLSTNLLVARVLWEAICQRRLPGGSFRWETLSTADLEAAESLMRSRWKLSTTHKAATRLGRLASFLAAHGICPSMKYRPSTPRQRDFNNHTLAGQDARRAKLPSQRALEGLADLYHDGLTEPPDRLRIAAVALLVVTGMRVGELLTLPLECEVEECQDGVERYGLRYHREKSGQGPERVAVRWLSAAQAQLARSAIQEIRVLTAQARDRARILEAHPNRVPIPGHELDDWLPRSEAARAMGLEPRTSSPPDLRQIPHRVEGKRNLYLAQELENHLLRWRIDPLWTLRTGPNSVQLLSETLLLAPRNFFHTRKPILRLLVEPLVIRHLSDFLTGRNGSLSVFQRRDICEPDGTPCQMTTHQFRHWLNDLADKGGMPVEMLSRWMGRKDARDTQDYRHATVDERLQWLKEAIRTGTVTGFMAEVYRDLPANEREVFLNGQVQAVHVTPLGFCVHDFAVEPCPYHLNCLRDCPHYLRTKGNLQERSNLIRIQDITVQALDDARQQANSDTPTLSAAWVKHHEDTLQGIHAALAVDNLHAPDGTLIPPHPERKHGKTQ